MNYRAAGARFQKKVEDYYKARGYAVQRAGKVVKRFPKAGKWVTITAQEDMFGAFDLMAVHPQNGIHMIQATMGGPSAISSRRNKVDGISELFPSSVFLELWTRPERGVMRCEVREDDGSWGGFNTGGKYEAD